MFDKNETRLINNASMQGSQRENVVKTKSITRLYLNPANTKISGRYTPNTTNVHCIINSESCGFSVEMPPLGSNDFATFWLYNIPESGPGYDVVISARKINNDTEITLGAGDTAILTDSMNGRYLAMIVRG